MTPLYTELMDLHADSHAVFTFCRILTEKATEAPRVLFPTGDGAAARQLLELGFPSENLALYVHQNMQNTAQTQEQSPGIMTQVVDLRLWSPTAEHWDAAWAPGLLENIPGQPHSSTVAQRILLSLFKALKPGGIVWCDYATQDWRREALFALLRQSGFDVILEAQERNSDPGSLTQRRAFIARRIGTPALQTVDTSPKATP